MAKSSGAPVFSFNGKRIIFVDTAKAKYEKLIKRLEKDGMVCEVVVDPAQFQNRLREESFDLCFLNLLIAGMGPSELISSVRLSTKNKDMKIVILTKQVHRLNIKNAISAGANDFIVDPFDEDSVYHRIHYHIIPKRIIDLDELHDDGGGMPVEFMRLLLEANETLSHASKEKEQGALYQVLCRCASTLKSNRTSLIIVDSISNSGLVLASSDDGKFVDFPISLTKYPEIIHVMNTGNFVCVEDVAQSSLTSQISAKVKDIPIGSIMVFPVLFRNDVVGVLAIRRPEATELPESSALRAIQAFANTLAAYSSIRALLRKIYKEFSKEA
ncbi:MAG: response regulator [Deltaproteobacteria bacterium]|nr:response regulator [Deltaproteobacteria bacterium]MBI3295270.1 response regulator [Deltaproteobacteria bacterium]